MNPFFQALDEGYPPEEIIGFISKALPQVVPMIKKATKQGYGIREILGFLSKSFDTEDRRGMSESERHSANSRSDAERTKYGLKLAATAAASTLAVRAAQGAIARALPASLTQPSRLQALSPDTSNMTAYQPQPSSPQVPGMQSTERQQTQTPIPSQQSPVSPEIISQNAPTIQPEVKSIELLLPEHAKKVDDLMASGNDVRAISGYFERFHKKDKKAIEKTAGMPFEKVVEQYKASKPPEVKPEAEAPKPIDKNESVLTLHGLGEVQETRNGQTIVEVDGKKHKVEEKSLLKPPKQAAIEALELIKSFTPEEMRSTHHMLNTYDEEEKKGMFFFHNGTAYVVDDISPEEYKELSEEIVQAKTKGETIIGKWAKGEGSRGAAYNKIVKGVEETEELNEKGERIRKVNPQRKKNYRKLRVGYNLLKEWQRLLNEK